MQELNIKDVDLEEKFILGSGKGGQKINRTSSCVQLKHLPTNIVIKCQESRSRELNRYYARKELCERLEQLYLGKESSKEKKIEKLQKQKKRRSRRSSSSIDQSTIE